MVSESSPRTVMQYHYIEDFWQNAVKAPTQCLNLISAVLFYFHFNLNATFYLTQSALVFSINVKKKVLVFLAGCFCLFLVHGVSGDDTGKVSVSVLEGDSVILLTGVDTNQQDRMAWYFTNIRIAQISGDQSKICTDVLCPQRFRDKLNLTDRSLMITSINTTDAGVYKLQITSRNIEKTFSVTVHDVHAAERDQMKRKSVKEGESVTLYPGAIKTNDVTTWYFNDTRIAKNKAINASTNVHSVVDETFRDRLKLDHQTGSLTITNTRTTDSGLYKLQINSIRFSIIRIISVTVTDSGLSSAVVARKHYCVSVVVALFIAAAVAAAAAAAAAIYYPKHQKGQK